MRKLKKKLILLDIDGTIVDNDKKIIHPSTIKALELLKQNNHELVIASGRAYFMLYSIQEIMHLINHYILINGQHIISRNSTIYEDTINFFSLEKLIRNLNEKNITYGFESAYKEAISEINSRVTQAFTDLNLNLPPVNGEFYKEQKVHQMWCFCDEKDIEELKKDNPEFDFVRWTTVGCDIIKKGQSKGKGLKFLIEELGMDIEDVIAIGDGDNDIEMVKMAGLGIAMGNATEKLKAVSDYVTDHISNDGFYKAFKYFGLIE